jgi:CPA2 family monovalent cation:H+ antiporter-2
VSYIIERGADQVVMGEREIASSMHTLMHTSLSELPRECPI